jgi:3',5'-cyclic AMP phosphodiesterase CpdA
MHRTRRRFLKTSAAATVSATIPARWADAAELAPGGRIKLRFAVASDLHYGQPQTPFAEMADEMVGWINTEKQTKGLDALFLNGDLTNDSSPALLTLRDKHLSKLQVPYYATKGNHDFLDDQDESPTRSWQTVWGHPANHTLKLGDFVFILADTTAPAKSDIYLAADIDWLRKQLEAHRAAPAIFVMIHIQQRAHNVDGWPKHGVHDREEMPKGEAVMDLLESSSNVRAVFHGHNHLETGVYISGERRYFFDSHVGGSWGAKRGYRIVEIREDHSMVTYQVNAEDDAVTNSHELPA